jgi:hypothetical protein
VIAALAHNLGRWASMIGLPDDTPRSADVLGVRRGDRPFPVAPDHRGVADVKVCLFCGVK